MLIDHTLIKMGTQGSWNLTLLPLKGSNFVAGGINGTPCNLPHPCVSIHLLQEIFRFTKKTYTAYAIGCRWKIAELMAKLINTHWKQMPHGLASRTIGQGKKRFLLSNELAGAPLVGADIGRRTRWRTCMEKRKPQNSASDPQKLNAKTDTSSQLLSILLPTSDEE
jgi:hypothetical protein